MNNEPLAWMQSTIKELPDGCECMQSVSFFKTNDNDIPLYTHPADLTDEEILELWYENVNSAFTTVQIKEFARAILRKAQ